MLVALREYLETEKCAEYPGKYIWIVSSEKSRLEQTLQALE